MGFLSHLYFWVPYAQANGMYGLLHNIRLIKVAVVSHLILSVLVVLAPRPFDTIIPGYVE